jgi:hypothetical protein
MSLLRDIQNELTSPKGDVTNVLRKCKILAARLGSEAFAHWVEWELNGYPDSQPTPEYRRLGVSCYADFMNSAWRFTKQPLLMAIVPEQFRDALQYVEFREGIAKITSLVSTGGHIDRPDLALLIQGRMFPNMNCMAAYMETAGSEFEQLISAIKNRILDFVLQIEAENPDAGEAPPNSQPVPNEKLQPLVNNMFYGPVGSVAQNSEYFTQTANIGIQPQDLSRLVTEFTNHLDDLSLAGRQKQRAEAQIAALKAELAGVPDPAIVKQAGRTLRSITEGAIGSLLATAAQPTVWH